MLCTWRLMTARLSRAPLALAGLPLRASLRPLSTGAPQGDLSAAVASGLGHFSAGRAREAFDELRHAVDLAHDQDRAAAAGGSSDEFPRSSEASDISARFRFR